VSQSLNHNLTFDEVRWATMRKTSRYDSRESFRDEPKKTLLPQGTRLYRLVPLATGTYFTDVWWMPERVFHELRHDAERASCGGGKLFRNYVVQYLALPNSNQLCSVEIELLQSVYAWLGKASELDGRPGGLDQCFLPNLAERGNPRVSDYARVLSTGWLRF
jgi:hypothetical protein